MVNVGSVDRALRILLGIALLLSPFLPPLAGFFAGWGAWKFAVAAVGLVLIATAVFRICPAYLLLGIRTCEVGKR
jgi:hypothetical protein